MLDHTFWLFLENEPSTSMPHNSLDSVFIHITQLSKLRKRCASITVYRNLLGNSMLDNDVDADQDVMLVFERKLKTVIKFAIMTTHCWCHDDALRPLDYGL